MTVTDGAAAFGRSSTGQTQEVDTFLLHPDNAPRAARKAVAECCVQAGAGEVCSTSSALMTSEIVTNAVVHGSGPVTFGVDWARGSVRVEVGDDNDHHPEPMQPDEDGEGGRGMMIVDVLATSWGVRDDPAGGKTVWFEVDAQP